MQFSKKDIQLAQKVLTTNLALQPIESLLVVTNPAMEKVEGALWFEAGMTITPKSQLVVVAGLTTNGQEPPQEIAELMSKADVIMLQTTFSLTHTAARRNANAQRARVASLPGANLDMIRRTLSTDYLPIKKLCAKIVKALSDKNNVQITNPAGTNLTFSIKDRVPTPDDGFLTKPGDYGNLPAGEAMLAPVEGTANGIYVVEGAFAEIPTDQPIIVTVKDGYATKIIGGKAAASIINSVVKVGPKGRNIAELGVGANPQADPQGRVLEAEKAYGTVHIALGNNLSYGGTVDVPLHLDGVILSPTLSVDNQVIIKEGEFNL